MSTSVCDCYDKSVCERFEREIRDHQAKVLLKQGPYLHMMCRKPKDSSYWFEIIVAPRSLTFRGDGESYVFHAREDMIEFFRHGWYKDKIHINTTYWAEKVTSDRDCLKKYDEEVFKKYCLDQIDDDLEESFPGLREHLKESIENCWEYDVYTDQGAREFLEHYTYKGFEFGDVWEMEFRAYDWWFLWALHAIVWAIKEHDKVHGDGKTHDVTEGTDITASLV